MLARRQFWRAWPVRTSPPSPPPRQGESEGGRTCFWQWKDVELSSLSRTSFLLPVLSAVITFKILFDQYFALINLNQKHQFCAKAIFSLLLILHDLGLQHQERAKRGLQAQRVGHRGAEEDQTLLEELLWQHRHTHLCDWQCRHQAVWGNWAGTSGLNDRTESYWEIELRSFRSCYVRRNWWESPSSFTPISRTLLAQLHPLR